ncbi:EthD family reductase [Candidatus Omnitrophota bacterium]
MENKPLINIVGVQVRPEDEEKWNKWHEEVHVPLLFKFKGLLEVTRNKVVTESGEYPKYITIYRFESQEAYKAYKNSPEVAAARDELGETWKEGKKYGVVWSVQYETMKTFKR